MNRVDEIEYMIACNELTAAQVFTQMRQLIPNKNIEAERDALRLKLIETAQELHCMIDMANAKLEQDICSTDDTPPDYFDAQTVHEAMILANKLEGKGDENSQNKI